MSVKSISGQSPGFLVDGLTVPALVGEGSAGPILCAAATGATRLVVGARGRSPAAGMLPGSVSQHVAPHAPCPVTVVRDPGLVPTRGSAPESRQRDDAVGVGG